MHRPQLYLPLIVIGLYFSACTKDVTIPFPEVDAEIVVDGQIVLGERPFVFLTRTQSFNAALDLLTLEDLFENDALVEVSNGTDTVQLDEVCAQDLTPEEQQFIATELGVGLDQLQSINYCAYVQLALDAMVGEVGEEYELIIRTSDGTALNAMTRILPPVPLDSIWFEPFGTEDSLGFVHALLSDPVGVTNAYRWSAQRINLRPGTDQPKDPGFIYPTGSAFEDRFFDGLQFEFIFNRGDGNNMEEDTNEEDGFFKDTDTIAVRFASITLETHDYLYVSDQQSSNNGSPFAVPANLPGNVEGGLGMWSGYSFVIDTFPK